MSSPIIFHVQNILNDPESFPHHQSVSQLWQTKWKATATAGTYPFVGGIAEDFEPIFKELEALSANSTNILFNPAEYAKPFLSVGESLVKYAGEEEKRGNMTLAQSLYLRANAIYRIARFPVTRRDCKPNWDAWTRGKEAYLNASKYFASPDQEIKIPFTYADVSRGDIIEPILAYLRVPVKERHPSGWPVLLFICGLDAYRTDYFTTLDRYLEQGFATLCLEIPGTGDCPASRSDPKAPERWFKSMLDWIKSEGQSQFHLDSSRIVTQGDSTGSYYAILLAHTHANELLGAVAQGTWSHHTLSPEWLNISNRGEYPFNIAGSFTYKLGYGSVEAAIADRAQDKFSLKTTGVLQKTCCRLLLVNGWEDTIFPIEDTLIVASTGAAKSIRLVENVGHMGRPDSEPVIDEWIIDVLTQSYK